MGLTVSVNAMSVSHKGSTGLSIAFPDICKTPVLGVPVPIPYPNIAMSSDLKKGSKKVKCDKKKVLLKSSKIKRSMGDEVGVQKGILSNKQMGKGKFANYSFDVKFEGKNVCRLLDPTTQNRSSLNTAAFAHLQKPVVADAPDAKHIKDACESVTFEKDFEETFPETAGGPKTSGITQHHWDQMSKFLDSGQCNPKFMIYFRSSGPHVGKWIDKHRSKPKECHEPKPHEWMDGLSCKEAREKDQKQNLENWALPLQVEALNGDAVPSEKEIPMLHAMGVLDPTVLGNVLTMEPLHGVIISIREAYGLGRPILGRKVWLPSGLNFKDQWMTGDYDMMDIIMAGELCKRPNPSQYGNLKMNLNYAMGWPGIQHPPQATYNTRSEGDAFLGLDKEKKGHFSNAQEISRWLRAGADDPAKRNTTTEKRAVWHEDEKQQRNLKMIDNDLTILGPGGGMHLKDYDDYWSALVCCGCLEVDPETENLDEDVGFKMINVIDEGGGGAWKGHGSSEK